MSPTTDRRWQAEDGASLAFILVFLVLSTSVVTALFSYAHATTRSMTTFRQERAMRYTADAALDAAVVWVQQGASRGVSVSPSPCNLRVPVVEPDPTKPVLAAGSFMTVTCTATPGEMSGGTEPDGGQAARDVTFTVRCVTTGGAPPGCGSGSGGRIASVARVRFEVDYEWPDAAARARLPKVLTWSMAR